MKKWYIVLDSSCDLIPNVHSIGDVGFSIAPLKILVGEKEFVDVASTDVDEMLAALKDYSGASSSACPSLADFAEEFKRAENIICITISSGLSGTYSCAMKARDIVLEEFPEKNIHVVDSKSTAGVITLIARYAVGLIDEGKSFEEIVKLCESYRDSTRVIFSLRTFDTLIKNGRMGKMAGIMASALNIRPIAVNSDAGGIEILEKCRGDKSAIAKIVEMTVNYKKITPTTPIIITHCNNPEGANILRLEIKKAYGVLEEHIKIYSCRCLTAFYSCEGSLLLSI